MNNPKTIKKSNPLLKILKTLFKNKIPGPDGFTREF